MVALLAQILTVFAKLHFIVKISVTEKESALIDNVYVMQDLPELTVQRLL
jgi:hypothetical protein